MQTDNLILTAFNSLFFLLFGAFILILIIASISLKGKSYRTKTIVLVTACLFTLVGFALYKYYLSLDEEFKVINAAMGGFNW